MLRLPNPFFLLVLSFFWKRKTQYFGIVFSKCNSLCQIWSHLELISISIFNVVGPFLYSKKYLLKNPFSNLTISKYDRIISLLKKYFIIYALKFVPFMKCYNSFWWMKYYFSKFSIDSFKIGDFNKIHRWYSWIHMRKSLRLFLILDCKLEME